MGEQGSLKDKCWFYSTRQNIEENTGLSEHKQRCAMNLLIKMNLISTKKIGIPCKVYYKLNEKNILDCYEENRKKLIQPAKNSVVENLNNNNFENSNSGSSQNEEQALQNLDINNNKNNNKKYHTHEETKIENSKNDVKIEYAKKVFLTRKEYQDLLNTYGEKDTKNLINQLSLYKQSTGKNYESDYATIFRWVVTRLNEIKKENIKYQDFKSKQNNKKMTFEQREYPTGFFDNLFAN